MINFFPLITFLIGVGAATLGALWILFPPPKVTGLFSFGIKRFWRTSPKFTGAYAARLLFAGGLSAIALGVASFVIPLMSKTAVGVSALLLLIAYWMGAGRGPAILRRYFFPGSK